MCYQPCSQSNTRHAGAFRFPAHIEKKALLALPFAYACVHARVAVWWRTCMMMNNLSLSSDNEFQAVEAVFQDENEHSARMESAQDAIESVANEVLATDASASETPAAETPAASNPFVELGLIDSLVKAISDLGYTQPTAVQSRVVPLAMRSAATLDGQAMKVNDLMVSSQTGSGKTAAFLLPVLHALEVQLREKDRLESLEWAKKQEEAIARGEPSPKRPRRKNPVDPRNFKAAVPQALILCPTRELAQQVAHDAIELVKHMRGVRIASVIGGLPYQRQIANLQNAMLVVATPGRLLDLSRSHQIKLGEVQTLILDEADRMLDLGFSEDLAAIHELTQQRTQTLMFSATFAPRIQQLGSRIMREPQRITVDTPQQKHANISQVLFWADNPQHRRALLDHWMRDSKIQQAIVFAGTQIECDGLANDLQEAGFSAVALHGALSQGLRNRRLMMLREGRVQFLVATDVAARGIDVPSISHVFNYGLPMKAEDYTHRIGRTGRAGRDGMAVTIAEFRDRRRVADVEHFTQQHLKVEVIPGLEPKSKPEPRGGFGKGRGDDRPRFGKGGGQSFGKSFGKPAGKFSGGKSHGQSAPAWGDAPMGERPARPAPAPRGFGGGGGFGKDGYGQLNANRDGYKREAQGREGGFRDDARREDSRRDDKRRSEGQSFGRAAPRDGFKPAGKPGFKKPTGFANKPARAPKRG
jgi:superfamily II DNA/RNA helicase